VQVTDLDDDLAFGARLRAERERIGLAVHELAHLCGRTDHTQRRYEAGKQAIPAEYIQALFFRTDIEVNFVLGIAQ
jgi:transcriptional regulator with XRE-family HTH domain